MSCPVFGGKSSDCTYAQHGNCPIACREKTKMTAARQKHLGPIEQPKPGSGMAALKESSIAAGNARQKATTDLVAAVRKHVATTDDITLQTALAIYDAAHR